MKNIKLVDIIVVGILSLIFVCCFVVICGKKIEEEFGNIVFGWVFVFLISMAILEGIRITKRDNSAPELTRRARLINKRCEVRCRNQSEIETWYLLFECDDGIRVEYATNENLYNLSVVGDVGDLVTKGTRFLYFQRVRG